uniref:serine C-palmitoyltransferase n=1 Tax=Ganoderma boninense TaxID=34458 RepID=A0A5K1K268_9APHY|nr:UDP-glucose 6-dehydrogenase (EC [Ganoderma boninense]
MPSHPSPIALNPAAPTQSIFKKKKKSMSGLPTAASYLSAVSEDTVLEETADDFTDGLSYPRVPPTSDQVFTTVHSEFGHCANEDYRYTSQHRAGTAYKSIPERDPPYYILLTTYISYIIVICLGHLRDFVGKRFRAASYRHLLPWNVSGRFRVLDTPRSTRTLTRSTRVASSSASTTASPTLSPASLAAPSFFSTAIPPTTTPDYNKTMVPTGTRTRALNISSYNYLGFAQGKGACSTAVEAGLEKYGVSGGGPRLEGGTQDLHLQAEALVSRFLGMEDALISSMGFATNSTIIPGLVGKGCLVISDELNHASIRFGCRLSGANVRMFKHNDMKALENLLREVISQGQPKTHRPWKKILLIVEGLYSMEGTLANLPVIMELKKKYKFYVFVDEAHSVGAMGPRGRGVTDYFGIDVKDVDILMGTFTKSFGAAGGYIAGSKQIIDRLRIHGHSGTYTEAMTPPVLVQIIASMASIMGITLPAEKPASPTLALLRSSEHTPVISECDIIPGTVPASALPAWMPLSSTMVDGSDGKVRLRRLAFNSRFLNRGLRKLGFITYGHDDSPVIPLLLFNPGKMAVFSRMMRTRATPIVVVVVAYPATPLVTSRVRFCLSAAHTKEDIDELLRACDEIGDLLDLKQAEGERWPVEEIINRAVELVRMPECP